MATHPQNLPKAYRPVKQQDRDVSLSFPYIINGIARPLEDTPVAQKGREWLPFYIRKVNGSRKLHDVQDYYSSINEGCTGGFLFVDQTADTPSGSKVTIIFSCENSIFLYKAGQEVSLLRNVQSQDSRTIQSFSGCQLKNYGYIVIGATTGMSAKWYRYESGDVTFPMVSVNNYGSGQILIQITGSHGLAIGDYVVIAGSNYSGDYRVVQVPSSSTFTVTETYIGNDTGSVIRYAKLDAAVTVTELDVSGLVAATTDRIISVPAYSSSDGTYGNNPEYSEKIGTTTTGRVDVFTSGTNVNDGGTFSGIRSIVKAVATYKEYAFLFEVDRVTVHNIRNVNDSLAGLLKDDTTHIEELTIDGYGVGSKNAVCVWRKRIFYVDSRNGVYEYNTDSRQNKELTAHWRENFFDYNYDDTNIIYDPRVDCLYVTCASNDSVGYNNTVLIYSFQTQCWSVDNGKQIYQFFYDPWNKDMYGIGSNEPKVYEVYGTNFNNEGTDIKLTVRTKYFEGDEREKVKEYIDSSVRVGFETDTQSFDYRKYFDEDSTATSDDTISCSDLNFGDGTTLHFARYHDQELLGNRFERMAIEIEEESSNDFAIFIPKINVRSSFEINDSSLDY